MNRRRGGPSTSGSTPASLSSISVCRALTVSSINLIKKAGERPLSKTAPGTPGRKAVTLRLAPQRSSGEGLPAPGSAARLLLSAGPGAVPVDPVIAPAGLQAGGQGERLAG